jgi:hypothetical protein
MLGITTLSPLAAVESDPTVAEAKARWQEAHAGLLLLEAQEKRLRLIMTRNDFGGRGTPPTDEELELDEAFEKLAPADASVTVPRFFVLPAAHAARKAVPKLRRDYLTACVPVRHRLHKAGLAQLRQRFSKLDSAIKAVLDLHEELSAIRTALLDLGADSDALPGLVPALDREGALIQEWRNVQSQLTGREAALVEADCVEA